MSLIVGVKIEIFYSFYLIIAGIIGLGIFVKSNLAISKRTQKQNTLDLSYIDAINVELIPLMGVITTLALKEDHKKEDLDLIQNYISAYTIAIGFDISKTINQVLKVGNLKDKKFEDGYNTAKNNLEQFQKFSFKLRTVRIEKFIADFEKHDK